MTGTTAAPGRHNAWRISAVLAISLALACLVGWRWWAAEDGTSVTRETTASAPVESTPTATAESADYRVPPPDLPSPDTSPMGEFPAGATVISGPEITAALSDHTALLPGGFVEYYAPDGKLHGMVEEKHYGGSWEVRNSDFCTMLEGSDGSICSPVERQGNTLYWSLDGEPRASPVRTMPGNPDNLR